MEDLERKGETLIMDESQQQQQQHVNKPNKCLSTSEKKLKRALKKRLKLQQKQIKLETRLRHAIRRKDTRVEQQTRQALHEMKQKNSQELLADPNCRHSDTDVHVDKEEKHDPTIHETVRGTLPPQVDETASRRMVAAMYQKLQQQQQQDEQETERQEQHRHGVSLLKHMTKGTQSRFMFENISALWGYTRQKFFERAMLVHSSFEKLRHISAQQEEQAHYQRLAWNKLTEPSSFQSICSIGCGPGNDVVGVVAFLQSLRHHQSAITESSTLKQVVMMDWAMAEWEKAIVNPLLMQLVPQYVENVETTFCDVTKRLHSSSNRAAWDALTRRNTKTGDEQHDDIHMDDDTTTSRLVPTCDIDLFLFSYILSEQRGLWKEFLSNLVRLAKPGALFYFAEPTPWQLHMVRNLFQDELGFVWVDSSMHFPSLQLLDNRVGPGVLMAMKKDENKKDIVVSPR